MLETKVKGKINGVRVDFNKKWIRELCVKVKGEKLGT
jgi:hypothetical protein